MWVLSKETVMEVVIKSFDVEMKVKNNGIELEVRDASGKSQIGDCYANKTGLIWCNGRKPKESGVKLTWEALQLLCASEDTVRVALAAVKEKSKQKTPSAARVPKA